MAAEPMFPILNDPIIKALPWSVMRPHEKQAQKNHSQTLNRLAQRGGLGIEEAYCVLKDIGWQRGKWNKDRVRIALLQMVDRARTPQSDPPT